MLGGLSYTLHKLLQMGILFLQYGLEAFRSGFAVGAFVDGYLAVMLVLMVQWALNCWKFYRKKEKSRYFVIETHMLFSFLAMITALLLMYKLNDGSKHLLTFIAAGIFIIPMICTKQWKKVLFLGGVFLFFYTIRAVSPYDYQVPYITAEREAQVEDWTEGFSASMSLTRERVPNYENVVIWVIGDWVEDHGESTMWQALYGLPAGYGISCCEPEYVKSQFEFLNSRYLFTPSGGEIDKMCREAGYQELHRSAGMILYNIKE